MSKGTLHIFCGKMASGKSTLAKEIAQQMSSVLISEDDMLGKLYPGEITDVQSYVRCSGKLKSAMRPVLVNLLENGTSVVLDFPANTVDQRKWMKGIVDGASAYHVFHYLDCTDEFCKAQLRKRASKDPEKRSTDTPEMFDAMSRYFEPPNSEEGFELLTYKRG